MIPLERLATAPGILEDLLVGLHHACGSFPDSRKGRTGNIAAADFGLSAFAMFFLQSESFLAFQRRLEIQHGRSNCQSLFGMQHIPSDNYIRSFLDGVAPDHLLPCFQQVLAYVCQHPKVQHAFSVLEGRTLVALDGTEYFCSYDINCPHCLHRQRNNGETEYYHTLLSATLVHPDHSQVLPLLPEFIANTDGSEKQDCERSAAKRWLSAQGKTLAPLRPIYLGDDLFACQPVIEALAGADFIFTCKPASHRVLAEFMQGTELSEHEVIKHRGKETARYRYQWLEDVPLNGNADAPSVNWFSLEIYKNNKRTFSSAWVTSLPVGQEHIAELTTCARARWKIENGSFNVMKNHGYELAHNFGHGKQFLAQTLAAFNLLAFAWHNLLDLTETLWQKAKRVTYKRTRFFQAMVMATSYFLFPDWQKLLKFIAYDTKAPDLIQRE